MTARQERTKADYQPNERRPWCYCSPYDGLLDPLEITGSARYKRTREDDLREGRKGKQ